MFVNTLIIPLFIIRPEHHPQFLFKSRHPLFETPLFSTFFMSPSYPTQRNCMTHDIPAVSIINGPFMPSLIHALWKDAASSSSTTWLGRIQTKEWLWEIWSLHVRKESFTSDKALSYIITTKANNKIKASSILSDVSSQQKVPWHITIHAFTCYTCTRTTFCKTRDTTT